MSERECMEYDIVVVGAGPAGLSCAIHLKQLCPEKSVCIIEKSSEIGAHILSGAVIETAPLDKLLPDWQQSPPSVCIPAQQDQFLFLSKNKHYKLPTPPQMHNKGNYIVSLGALCQWLAPQAEALGVEIYPGFAAAEPLFSEKNEVIGVRVGDMGIAKDGSEKATYTQGIDIKAPITIFAEGCRGHLTKQVIKKYELDKNADPQTYAIGMKELWQLPPGTVTPGLIQHTVGWPLDNSTYGGSFIYHLDQDRVAIGFVVGLDYQDPSFNPFEAFQQFKHHPAIKSLLTDGKIVSAGARALVEGGYQSLPKLEMPGAILIGDCAGTLNVPKIKGTHMAMWSGIIAAEHIQQHNTIDGFDTALRSSIVGKELHKVRNIRPGFQKGLWSGLINAAWETITAGKSPWTKKNHADHSALKKLDTIKATNNGYVERSLMPKDRLASVFFASTEHDEDQPVHLQILDPNVCIEQCKKEYNNPCTRFCPAGVYELVNDEQGERIHINAANCVHCKTCDIKDPYQIINWVTPEGGSGPNYQNL